MSIRVRLTVTAVLVVGAALVGGAAVLVWLLGSALTDQVCAAAREQAERTAAAVDRGEPLGASAQVTQVLDAGGNVADSSPDLHGRAPLEHGRTGECRTIEPPGFDDDYAVVAAGFDVQEGPALVVVGRPLVDVLDSTQFVTRALLIGLPVVLLLVGATTWYVVGRTLAPVAAITREADGITAADLGRRVPQPDGSDEVARLAATVNRMLDRLERAQAGQRRFVSDASHELRSPIATIRQYAELALAHPDRMTLPELARVVLTEDLRIQRLVEDLLVLARADEQMLQLPSATVDLDDLVLAEARQLRATTGLTVDTSAVSAGQVRGDPAALQRVLRNLTENAARYARTTVRLTLAETGQDVVLTVSDDGPGVPPVDRDRVFERFVRLGDARTRDDGGSGLGLAIVAELVRVLRGSVRLGESPLGGARFEVRLPTG